MLPQTWLLETDFVSFHSFLELSSLALFIAIKVSLMTHLQDAWILDDMLTVYISKRFLLLPHFFIDFYLLLLLWEL